MVSDNQCPMPRCCLERFLKCVGSGLGKPWPARPFSASIGFQPLPSHRAAKAKRLHDGGDALTTLSTGFRNLFHGKGRRTAKAQSKHPDLRHLSTRTPALILRYVRLSICMFQRVIAQGGAWFYISLQYCLFEPATF